MAVGRLRADSRPQNLSELPGWKIEIEYWRKIEKAKLFYRDAKYSGKDIKYIDEYTDAHTRAAIILGGSYYHRRAHTGISRRHIG